MLVLYRSKNYLLSLIFSEKDFFVIFKLIQYMVVLIRDKVVHEKTFCREFTFLCQC